MSHSNARSSGHWSKGLVASMSDPKSVMSEDQELCVIKDKYPKAKLHLLVLPKDPRLNTMKNLEKSDVGLISRMAEAGIKQSDPVPVRLGFHAVPSMGRLHLHVIRQD